MEKKSYKITFDLKEGYAPAGEEQPIELAEAVIAQWMNERLESGLAILSGMLQQGTLIYPAPDSIQNNKIITSSSAIFSGELSSAEDLKRKDDEVRNTLEDLARIIKSALKQQSVFITYLDQHWCL